MKPRVRLSSKKAKMPKRLAPKDSGHRKADKIKTEDDNTKDTTTTTTKPTQSQSKKSKLSLQLPPVERLTTSKRPRSQVGGDEGDDEDDSELDISRVVVDVDVKHEDVSDDNWGDKEDDGVDKAGKPGNSPKEDISVKNAAAPMTSTQQPAPLPEKTSNPLAPSVTPHSFFAPPTFSLPNQSNVSAPQFTSKIISPEPLSSPISPPAPENPTNTTPVASDDVDILERLKKTITISTSASNPISTTPDTTSVTRHTDEQLQEENRKLRYVAAINAVADAIKAKKQKISPTSVFAVVIKYLVEKCDSTSANMQEPFLKLLEHVSSEISKPVFRARAAVVSKLLSSIASNSRSSSPTLKSVVLILRRFILALSMEPMQTEVAASLKSLLYLAQHSDPKVSINTHKVIAGLVKKNQDIVTHISPLISSRVLDLIGIKITPQVNARFRSYVVQAQNILLLVQRIVAYLPQTVITSITGPLLHQSYKGAQVLQAGSLQVLQACVNSGNMTSSWLLSLLESLRSHEDYFRDSDNLHTFADMLTQCLVALKSVDEHLFSTKLSLGFTSIIPLLRSTLSMTAANCLKTLVGCVPESMILAATVGSKKTASMTDSPLESIIDLLVPTLSMQYRPYISNVMRVWSAVFEQLGSDSASILENVFLTLCELHETPEFKEERGHIEMTIQSAIRAMGVENIIKITPLNLDSPLAPRPGEDTEPNRAWLLPLMRTSIKLSDISIFLEYFIPMANLLKKTAEQKATEGYEVESKNLSNLYDQVWDLFPAFCSSPVGIDKSFPKLAPILGTIVKEKPTQNIILAGLCTLVTSLRKILSSEESTEKEKSEAQKALQVMGRFGKNFLPCLLNVMSTSATCNNKLILDTIRAYASLSPTEVVNGVFKEVFTQVIAQASQTQIPTNEDNPSNQKMESEGAAYLQVLAALCSAFAAHLNSDNLQAVLDVIEPLLMRQETVVQKRVWNLLAVICMENEELVNRLSDKLRAIIVNVDPVPAAKRFWLKFCYHVMVHLSQTNLPLVIEVLFPRVLIHLLHAVKENNLKSRKQANKLLVKLAYVMSQTKQGLQGFVNLLLASLASKEPHTISSCVLALARVVYEFHEKLDVEQIQTLMNLISLLLDSATTQVSKAALSFIKVCVVVLPRATLKPAIPKLVEKLGKYAKQSHKTYRLILKHIMERMMRKLGYEEVAASAQEGFRRILKNMMRSKANKLTKKGLKFEQTDSTPKPSFDATMRDNKSSDDDDDEAELLDLPSRKRQRAPLEAGVDNFEEGDYEKDADEEEETDLLDGNQLLESEVKAKPARHDQANVALKKDKESEPVFLDADGKIVVKEDINEAPLPYSPKRAKLQHSTVIEAKPVPIKSEAKGGASAQSSAEEGRKAMYQRMIDRRQKALVTKQENERKKMTGEKFRAKKAGGDIHRNGKQPYAYIPMNPRLGLKKKGKPVIRKGDQFKGIIGAAKRGSDRGSRAKRRKVVASKP
ncbi:Ribosomal RNA-processing protein 12 [Pelomyxa schiedti]|nr:Ribosomal RNA-processing protein 12 [Pelomyxa schiedti]